MIVRRRVAGAAFVAAAVAAAITSQSGLLAAGGFVAVAAWACVGPRGRTWQPLLPIALFATGLAAVQLVSAGGVTLLPVKTVVVFLLARVAWRVSPPINALETARPHSRLWTLALFLLVTHHFVQILKTETARVWRAWALRVPRRFGPLGLRSLSWAVVAVSLRCWTRAERFYAAQRLRGLTA
jgi:energy-coupling factor transporter transmembrane protein EcfT